MITVWGGGTQRTLRVHWMCHELDIDYRSELIGSRTGATNTESFRALNPKEKIPVLMDGDLVLTESAAIITYLAEHHGQGKNLIPEAGSQDKARYDQWLAFVQMELDAHTLYVIRKHRDLAHLYGEGPGAIKTAIAGFQKQVAVAAQHLNDRAFLVGDHFSGADLMLTSALEWAKAYDIPLDPGLTEYHERQISRPAYIVARKHNFSISAGA